jgi:hypothetical protein
MSPAAGDAQRVGTGLHRVFPLGNDGTCQGCFLGRAESSASRRIAEGPRRPVQPEAWLDRMIEAELTDRQVRSSPPPWGSPPFTRASACDSKTLPIW